MSKSKTTMTREERGKRNRKERARRAKLPAKTLAEKNKKAAAASRARIAAMPSTFKAWLADFKMTAEAVSASGAPRHLKPADGAPGSPSEAEIMTDAGPVAA